MKKTSAIATAALIAAVFVSCNNGTHTVASDSMNSADHSHMEHTGSNTSDTATIKDGQEVYFVNPKEGQSVTSPLTIEFGVKGMTVLPIDSGVIANTGHHHLFIDTFAFIPAGEVVPAVDGRIIHFGNGQTKSAPLQLTKGSHKLSIQFADGLHRSYGVKMSKTIMVQVK